MICLVAVVSARPQVDDYSSITDENDPRFMFDPNPQYSYKYQVSDDPQQTYIAHEEQRDGAAVSGQYSYVDPNGALIVVKYTAGDDGYQETREVQQGFVSIRAKPVKKEVIVPAPRPAPRPAPVRKNTDSDLVARIISQLTPFIKTTVADSLGSQQRTTSRVVAVQQPVVQTVRAVPVVTEVKSSSTQSLFGVDGENRITVDSPNYSFDKILF